MILCLQLTQNVTGRFHWEIWMTDIEEEVWYGCMLVQYNDPPLQFLAMSLVQFNHSAGLSCG